jgi:hypothetical protein
VVRRAHNRGKGATPRIFVITLTRMPKASGCDHIRLQIGESGRKSLEVCRACEDGEVGVAAKFGRAVQHASLPAHEQGADVILRDRRKDFAYRVRDQATLRGQGMWTTVLRSRRNADAGSGDTSRPIPARPPLQDSQPLVDVLDQFSDGHCLSRPR